MSAIVLAHIVYHQDSVRHLHFLSFAEAVDETSNTTFLASVNFLLSFYF